MRCFTLTSQLSKFYASAYIDFSPSPVLRLFVPSAGYQAVRVYSSIASMGSGPDHYAAIILGSGQGATPLSTSLAKAGHRTLLIEASHIGGSKQLTLSESFEPLTQPSRSMRQRRLYANQNHGRLRAHRPSGLPRK
jgi:hypothetical protein